MNDIQIPDIYAPFIPYIINVSADDITFKIPDALLGDCMAVIAKSKNLREFRLPEIKGQSIFLKISTASN